MTPPSAAKHKKANSRSRRHDNARSERLRTFSLDIIPLIRADIEAAHGKPEKAEPSVMEFIDQFFDEIHELRDKKFAWDAIHERLSKYVDCSARTLQSYYNIIATKRGVSPEATGKRGPRSKAS
jgi:hypothetical protein